MNYKLCDAWFLIPGFNGYQINPYRKSIRSMKMMYKDPGHILKPKYSDTYELTANNSSRVKVSYRTLYDNTFVLCKRKPQSVSENSTNFGARQKTYTDCSKDTFNPGDIHLDLTKNVVDNIKEKFLIHFYD